MKMELEQRASSTSHYTLENRNDETMKPMTNSALARQQFRHILVMSVCFSIVESCLIGVLSLQTSLNDAKLASFSTGAFYFAYVLSFLVVPVIFHPSFKMGPKWTLVLGLSLIIVYMGSQIYESWYTKFPGSFLGGFGGAFIWTSEGTYLTKTAVQYAKYKGISQTSSLGYFSGVFYSTFQACLILGQLYASLILSLGEEQEMKIVLFSTYTIIALVALAAMAFFLPPLQKENCDKNDSVVSELGAESCKPAVVVGQQDTISGMLLATGRNCLEYGTYLLIPSNIAFGFIQNFQFDYFNAVIVKESVGAQNIGYVGSILALVAALQCAPMGKLSDKYGCLPFFLAGAIANIVIVIIVLTINQFNWGIIIGIGILVGTQNAVWGTVNAAFVGEVFVNNPAPAFANLKMWSGAATTFAFLAYPYITINVRMYILLIFSGLGIIGFILAHQIRKRDLLQGWSF